MDTKERDVRYKVLKSLTWREKGYTPGTEAAPVYVWMTEAEAKDWLADGHIAASPS